MADFQPELGQMMFSNTPWTQIRTPGYVTDGIGAINDLYVRHVEGGIEDEYGSLYSTGLLRVVNSAPEVVNDIFALRSYCWCDGEREGHEDGCPPNFEHFASGFKAFWYKHSSRGESCNRQLDRTEWMKIQRECEDWILQQPTAYRVLVTGSREWASDLYATRPGKKYPAMIDGWRQAPSPDRDVMQSALRDARARANGRHMVIVHGGARGADHLASMLGFYADNAHTEPHPADWDRQDDGSYDRSAGFRRNQKMVDLGADLCLAFLKKGAGNRGTKHCADLARKAGIEVVEVWSG